MNELKKNNKIKEKKIEKNEINYNSLIIIKMEKKEEALGFRSTRKKNKCIYMS
jgi:hypothetical protein